MTEVLSTQLTDTFSDADHTHDEHLRGYDLRADVPQKRDLGSSALAALHEEYGEIRDGIQVIPAAE